MRPVPLTLSLVAAVLGPAAVAVPAADAARSCGTVRAPYTDGQLRVTVSKGRTSCPAARSLAARAFKATFDQQRRTVTVRSGGRSFRCTIDANRTAAVCSHRSGGRLRDRVRAAF